MLKVIGLRVQVAKEKIDSGGLKLTPQTEQDGLSNTGKIVSLGSVWLRLAGLKVGQVIHFRKHFITNAGQPNELTFVSFGDILAIEK